MRLMRFRYVVAGVMAVVLLAGIFVAGCTDSEGTAVDETTGGELVPGQGPESENRQVSDKVWQATLALHVEFDPEQADQPADVAVLGGESFVLDTGHGRLLKISADGQIVQALDEQIDPKLVLSTPMAIASNQRQLYVADTEAAQAVLVTSSGEVSRVISLSKGSSADALPPRPIGIVAWDDGSFAVSDANNHRVIKYDIEGNMLWMLGSGIPAVGQDGFNVPGGLALDNEGNVYVVDILNAQVKKYSADGVFMSAFGESGDTAGKFSRAKAVAVDNAGNIYVSDGLGLAVQVFDQTGVYLGFVGRQDPSDQNSESLFQAPHGLTIVDGKLYVVDRFAGLFVFDLPVLQQETST